MRFQVDQWVVAASMTAVLVGMMASAPVVSGDVWLFTTSETAVRGAPGSHHGVVVQLGAGRALSEISRLGPGRHLIGKSALSSRFKEVPPDEVSKGMWGDVEKIRLEIPEGDGSWVFVSVLGEGAGQGERGWVSALEVGPRLSAAEYREAIRKQTLAGTDYIEPDALISDSITPEMTRSLREYIGSLGHVCDTVSAIVPFLLSEGFTVRCNRRRYGYEVENKGGRWIVTVL